MDKRKPIKELYEKFNKLENGCFIKEEIFSLENREKRLKFPIFAFRTRKTGNSLWIISGMHGEELAGPNALAENIDIILELGGKYPVVFIPLCNPIGYFLRQRYFDKKNSVGDSSHLLLNKNNQVRKKFPSCSESDKLTKYFIELSKKYKPKIFLDFHEDILSDKAYIYSQGKFGCEDVLAKKIINCISTKFEIWIKGKTRSGEKISNGIICNVKDSSIDELMASEKIIVDNTIVKGPCAETVIVVESPAKKIELNKRIELYSKILEMLRDKLVL